MTELNVLKRDVKASLTQLRSEGKAPGVCYGSGIESTPVLFDEGEFRKVYREVGTSSVIDLGGDMKGQQCFVQDMQVHVVSGEILHVDFKVVAAGETTEVTVPVETEGEAPAVTKKEGILNVSLNEISIEAVPSKVPAAITVDVSTLEIGDNIKVTDLKLPEGVTALEDADAVVVSISGLQEESEEESDGPSMEEVLADPNADAEETDSE
jgi:large subunit ribosomal protein L25